MTHPSPLLPILEPSVSSCQCQISLCGRIPEWHSERWFDNGRTAVELMLDVLRVKLDASDDHLRELVYNYSFVEDMDNDFWARGRDGSGCSSLRLLHARTACSEVKSRHTPRHVLALSDSMLRGMPHPEDQTTPAMGTDFAAGSTAYRSCQG